MKRRGISPLIATVLIIGFTVALAAIIMTWGTGFTKRMQTSTEETANIQIICATDVVFDIESVCWDSSGSNDTYKVLISNDGKEDIKKWRFRLYESESDVNSPEPIATPIDAFNIGTVSISSESIGKKKIEAIPIIQRSGVDVVCVQNIDSYGDIEGDLLSETIC